MSLRYLYGPRDRQACENDLPQAMARGDCLTFDADTARQLQSWDELQATFQHGWQPDIIAVYLPYSTIPAWLWDVPVPLVGLACDPQLLWHSYRPFLPMLDRILTDAPTVERLHRAGIDQARPECLYGLSRAYMDEQLRDGPRDLDVVFCGSCQPAIQRDRLRWLGRLARHADRWRIQIASGIFGTAYRNLLRRARIVFNRSVRGEANQRIFEAIACGCLLFQERSNLETPALLRDRQECVYYDEHDLGQLLDHYLNREDERLAIVEAARSRLNDFTYEAFLESAFRDIEVELPLLRECLHQRPSLSGRAALMARATQSLSALDGGGSEIVADLEAAAHVGPPDAQLLTAIGALRILHAGNKLNAEVLHQAVNRFGRALNADPGHLIASLSLAETLAMLGQDNVAADVCRQTLTALDRDVEQHPSWLHAATVPPGFEIFRVEWERAGWEHAGDVAGEARAKRELIRWRLHALLAQFTGELVHYHEAAVIRPDLSLSRAMLGCALGRANQPRLAVAHLRAAVDGNPFDAEASRALHQALSETGDSEGSRRLARDRRLLHAAAPGLVQRAGWFLESPPAADELASILILCCNELDYTRQCIESIARHTRSPYELIILDNGSTDGTPAYLSELSHASGAARVVVLRNEQNRGFPAGCNQALREARGRFIVFLNNDTVVTPAWLDGLVNCVVHDWPHVGMVGAVSNYAPRPQQVEPEYRELSGLDEFARRRSQEFVGKALEHPRLTGFCLLARREVLEQVGGFDESFGVGLFEDDDLCLKVADLGYRLLIALDVYIHHYGSRTFAGLGIDTQQKLEENFARFQAKWGPTRTAPYRAPQSNGVAPSPRSLPVALTPPQRPHTGTVSLVMIVKNEEDNLPDCLGSVQGLFTEIIVLDTGSTDRTREIAREFGAKVLECTWPDSFSAARNLAQSHATGDWIFWMDADDRLDDVNYGRMRALIESLKDENVAYRMKCVCLPDPVSQTTTVVDHVRLFRNWPHMCWQFRVHEQILWSLRRYGGKACWSNVVITHVGYQDPALRGRKLQRDLRLLQLDLQEYPGHPFLLFNLGSILQEQGRHEEAIQCIQGSLARSDPSDSITHKLYSLLAGSHKALGHILPALSIVRDGRKLYPTDHELLYREAALLKDLGNYSSAEASCLELFAAPPPHYFGSVDAGLQGYKGRHLLAEIYKLQQKIEAAEAQWRLAVADHPGFGPAWNGLADIALGHKDRALVDEVIAGLSKFREGKLEADLLQGRWLMAVGDFAGAAAHADRMAKEYPGRIEPHVLHSRALLHLGGDRERVEWSWREVLKVDPAHPEALHTLANLLRERSRSESAYYQAKAELTGWVLHEHYQAACLTPSEIREHLPVLQELATGSKHCTTFGTSKGLAVLALLSANPDAVVCYENAPPDARERLAALAGDVRLDFRTEDVLSTDIADTDLLFIDARHSYEQRKAELARHAPKVRKYIVLAQTSRFAEAGEAAGDRGVWPAVEEFLTAGTFRLKQRWQNNNGLAVLERVVPPAS